MSEQGPKRARKPKWRRRLWRAAWISSLLGVALYLSREWTVHPLLTRAAGPLGRLADVELEVDDLSGNWFGGLRVEGLRAQPIEGDAWSVEVQHASLAWSSLSLIRGHDDWLESVEVEDSRVEFRPGAPTEESDEDLVWPTAPTWLPLIMLRDINVVVHEESGNRLEIINFAAVGRRDGKGEWALDASAHTVGRVTPHGIFGSKVEVALTYDDQWVDLERIDIDGRPWVSASHIDLGGLTNGLVEVELEATGPSERTTLRVVLADDHLDADIEVTALDLALVETWAPGLVPEGTEGLFDVRVQVSSDLDDPLSGSGSVRVDGGDLRVLDRAIDEVLIRGAFEDHVASLSVFDLLAGETTIKARDLSVRIMDTQQLPTEDDVTGTFSLKSTDIDVLVRGAQATNAAPEHALEIEGTLTDGALTVTSGSLTVPGGHLALDTSTLRRSSVDRSVSWPVDVEASIEIGDLAPLGQLLGYEDWTGSVTGLVAADGSLSDPYLITHLEGAGITIAGLGIGAANLTANSTLKLLTIEPSGFEGDLGSGSVVGMWSYEDQRFDEVVGNVTIHAKDKLGSWIDPGGRFAMSLSLDGPLLTPTGSIGGRASGIVVGGTKLDRFTLDLQASDGTWTLEELTLLSNDTAGLYLQEPATIVWTDDRRAIESLLLDGPSGSIEASGELLGGDANFAVELKDIEPMPFLEGVLPKGLVIGELTTHLQSARTGADWTHSLDGSVLVYESGSGADAMRAAEPVVVSWDGSLDAAGIHLKELAAEYHGDKLAFLEGDLPYAPFVEDPWLDGDLTLLASGQVPEPLKIALPLDKTIRTSIAAPSRFDLDLAGTWHELRGSIDMNVEGIVVTTPDGATGDLLSPGKIEVHGQIGEGGITFERLHVDLPNKLVLDLEGSLGLPQDVTAWTAYDFAPLDAALDLQGTFHAPDLAFVAGLDPGMQRSSGALDVDLDLHGTLANPRGRGSIALTDAMFKTRGAPHVDGINGTCAFDDGVFNLTELTAHLGAAPTSTSGTIDWTGEQPAFDLTVDGTNVLLLRDADLRMRSDLNLTVQGTLDALLVAGSVGLRNSRVTQSIDLLGALEGGSGFKSQEVGLLIAPFKEGPLADMRFDVQIDTLEPVDLVGNLMRGSAKASLRLTGTGRGIYPDGAVFVQPTRISLPGGSLTFTGGSVRFSKATPLFPTLDIYGETRMIGFDVNCHITGSIADPVIELSSSPPLPQDDLLILLLTGRLPSQSTGQQAAEALTIYIARDAFRAFFTDGSIDADESFIDRFEYESGREISDKGIISLEARFRIADGVLDDRDAVHIVAERDRFEDFNMGLRFTLRLR